MVCGTLLFLSLIKKEQGLLMNVARVCSSHPLKWPGHLVARAEYEEHAGANLFSKAGLEEGIFFFLLSVFGFFW